MSDLYDDPNEKAAKLGLAVRRPQKDELFVDIDGPEAAVVFEERRELFDEVIGIREVTRTPSRSPGHEHVVVVLWNDVTDYQRIAYQLALGSDPKRETLALGQVNDGRAKDAVVFFEQKV